MQRKFSIVSKTVYGTGFSIQNLTTKRSADRPFNRFFIYTLLNNLKYTMEWLLFGRPIMFFLSPPPMLILLVRAFKSIALLVTTHASLSPNIITLHILQASFACFYLTYSLHLFWNKNLENTF